MIKQLLSLTGLFLCPFLFSQISVNGSQIKDLADPTEAQDAVTKAYIQALEEKLNRLQNSIAKKGYFSDDILWQRSEENENNFSTGFRNDWNVSLFDSYDNTVILGQRGLSDNKIIPLLKKLDTDGNVLWERSYDISLIEENYPISIIENNSKNGYVITLWEREEINSVYNIRSGLFEINHEGELINYFVQPIRVIFQDINSFTDGYVTVSHTVSENNNFGFRVQEFSNNIEPTNSFFVDMDENFTAEKIIPFQGDYVICGNKGDNGVVFRINLLTQQIIWTKSLVAKQTKTIKIIEEDIFIVGIDNRETYESGFVMKIDQYGDIQDEAYLDRSPITNMTTHNNDLYLIGTIYYYFSSVYGLTGYGQDDVIIHKLNYNLGIIWSKNYGGSYKEGPYVSQPYYAASIHIKNNNNIIIGAQTSSNDFLVERIKSPGNSAIWILEIQNN
ncbi:MAG: hypothetical protein P8H45_00860 [Flavobacteriaceae bacterium]|nr:hypothetical protein [Flavobacteriaceae bacterium]